MQVRSYENGRAQINMPSEDVATIMAILEQISMINQDLIQQARPPAHPELTYERVQQLKKQLSKAILTHSENSLACVELSDILIHDLNAILIGAYAIDDEFLKDGKPISEQKIETLMDDITLISHGLMSEKDILLIEQLQGVTVPRFK